MNTNTCFHRCCFCCNSDSLSRSWCMQTSSNFHITRYTSWKTILNYNQWKLIMEKRLKMSLMFQICTLRMSRYENFWFETYGQFQIGKHLSEMFLIRNGLKKGHTFINTAVQLCFTIYH